MRPHRQPAGVRPSALDALLDHRAVYCVYQPIIALTGRQIIGFEALARGPVNTPWHNPTALIAAATRIGRLPELDWICRAAACRGALAAGLAARTPLFINIEPATITHACPSDLRDVIEEATDVLQIVAEITERAIADDPAALLATVDRIRGRSVLVALDDVGADPASQAMMPLIAPDVIKIDRSVIEDPATERAAAVIAAVQTQARRSGAVVLAEGIETPRQLADAVSLGAALGQGFHLGRPAPLPPPAAAGGTVQTDRSASLFPRASSNGLKTVATTQAAMLPVAP